MLSKDFSVRVWYFPWKYLNLKERARYSNRYEPFVLSKITLQLCGSKMDVSFWVWRLKNWFQYSNFILIDFCGLISCKDALHQLNFFEGRDFSFFFSPSCWPNEICIGIVSSCVCAKKPCVLAFSASVLFLNAWRSTSFFQCFLPAIKLRGLTEIRLVVALVLGM